MASVLKCSRSSCGYVPDENDWDGLEGSDCPSCEEGTFEYYDESEPDFDDIFSWFGEEYVDEALEQVFLTLLQSCQYGNLGFLIGTGFSRHLGKDSGEKPLSWLDLVKKCWEELEIEEDEVPLLEQGETIPSYVARVIVEKKISKSTFKKAIAGIVGKWELDESLKNFYEAIFKDKIAPQWIVTTNYDDFIEQVLDNECTISSGNSPFLNSKKTAVHHLHGIVHDYKSLVMLDKDYLELNRPNSYSTTRLSLLFAESTTLVFGYNLNDPNVVSALDWAQNFYRVRLTKYPREFIILNRDKNISRIGVQKSKSHTIVDIPSINAFFEAFDTFISKLENFEDISGLSLKKEILEKFSKDSKFRQEILLKVETGTIEINAFLSFFKKFSNYMWDRCFQYGRFNEYGAFLNILFDCLELLNVNDDRNKVLFNLGTQFEKISPYVGSLFGQSFSAARIWRRRKNEIFPETRSYFKKYFNSESMKKLLEEL